MTREERAVVELGSTRFSPGVCATLVVAFLATLVAVPVFDAVSDVRKNVLLRRELQARGVPTADLPGRRPRALEIFDLLPSWRAIAAARHAADVVALLPQPAQLRRYEDHLSLDSAAGKLVRPWLQWALTGWLGTGSEKVVVGRDGWLYYGDGVDYVTGPGFLAPDTLARRAGGQSGPDPRVAIRQFRDVLKESGTTLVVFPVPEKALIRPGPLSAPGGVTPQNPSWAAFKTDLEEAGVPLLDITDEMYARDTSGDDQFLRTDSHWTPSGADGAAAALARLLTEKVGLPAGPALVSQRRTIDIVRYGDLARLLNLPPSRAERLSPTEHVSARQVVSASGQPWQPDPSSDILLIGDSFLEIYSSGEPATSVSAGLAEQLSYYLQRPTDRIASHELWDGATARWALGKTLPEVRNAARGRKIVVWEFAMRYLATADWPSLH